MSTIHGDPSLQPTGLKGFATNALDTTGYLQSYCVHASGQSQVQSKVAPSAPMDQACFSMFY